MRGFRTGSFKRHQIPGTLRRFAPEEALETLESVDLKRLWLAGKRLVMLDVDNTLLPWRTMHVPAKTMDWIAAAKEQGFKLVLLSNTRKPERLHALAGQMGVEYVRAKFKPSRQMYNMALEKFGFSANEAVMIGDQLFTDVLGANRSGIDAYWVCPMGKREFIGTRVVSRNLERVVGLFLHRYFQLPEGEPDADRGFFRKSVVQQFIKFCIVGATSTAIDAGLSYLFMFVIPVNGEPMGSALGRWMSQTWPGMFPSPERISDPAFPVLQVPATCIAILNGFYWNRKWTFGLKGEGQTAGQLRKYFLVQFIGLALGTGLATLLNNAIPGHPKRSWAIAKAVATVVVAFWNFTGSRLFVFRDSK